MRGYYGKGCVIINIQVYIDCYTIVFYCELIHLLFVYKLRFKIDTIKFLFGGTIMKKYLTITLILLMLFTLFGCNSNNGSLSSEQQKAVNNSINYIKNSKFAAKDRINTNIITIKNADEKTWEFVYS